MKKTFEVGDRVYLASGSPEMTIIKIEGELCHCVWDNPESPGDFGQHTFPAACLREAEDA